MDKYIEHIIAKRLVGPIDQQEQENLDLWIAASDVNKQEYEAYAKLWKQSETLVVSDTIDVEAALRKTKRRIVFSSKRKWFTYMRQVAAVLLLSVMFSYLYTLCYKPLPQQVDEQEIYQEITAAYGTRSKLSLADGTQVWLNSGSTLRFPTTFKYSHKRQVQLDGEGYFEVKTDSLKPFVVNTSKLDVRVYGTSFNVAAYDSQNKMTVALTEGRVGLIDDSKLRAQELSCMEANDVVVYNEENGHLSQRSDDYIEKYVAWKDGQIIFYGDPIDVVVRRLEKWYNVEIIVADNKLNSYRFTATFIDESLEQVLRLLSLSSDMQYSILPARKKQDNTFSKRVITLRTK